MKEYNFTIANVTLKCIRTHFSNLILQPHFEIVHERLWCIPILPNTAADVKWKIPFLPVRISKSPLVSSPSISNMPTCQIVHLSSLAIFTV